MNKTPGIVALGEQYSCQQEATIMSVRIISDPLGNIVYLSCKYHLNDISAECLDEDIVLIINVPALIITVYDPQPELYHYRSVGWNLTMMFKSVKENSHWTVIDCIKNPGVDTLKELLNRGKMVAFNS